MMKYFFRAACCAALLGGLMTAVSCTDNKKPDGGQDKTVTASQSMSFYYGDFKTNGQGNYYLKLSTAALDAEGNPTGPGEVYCFDLYGALSANAQPAAGDYTRDAANSFKAGTFTASDSFMTAYTGTAGNPIAGTPVYYTAGTLKISGAGADMKVSALVKLASGQTVRLSGENLTFTDHSNNGGGDDDDNDTYTEMTADVNIIGTDYIAEYYGNIYDVPGMSDYSLGFTTADETEAILLDLLAPEAAFSANGIQTGTYTVVDPTLFSGDYVALAGMMDEDDPYPSLYINSDDVYGLISSGTVKITKSGSNYTITVDCMSSNGHKIKGSYTGPIVVTDESGNTGGGDSDDPSTTLRGDHTIDFSAVKSASADFYGQYYDEVNAGDWWILLDPETAGKEGFDIELLVKSTTSTTIPTGKFNCDVMDAGAVDTFLPGYLDSENYYNPTMYYKYDADLNVDDFAPAADGSINITKSGSNYTFDIDVYDDGGNHITGTWTGPVAFSDKREAAPAQFAARTSGTARQTFAKVRRPSAALRTVCADMRKARPATARR